MADEKKLNETLVGVWNALTDEQKEKAKGCKTADELFEFAGKEGVELPDEALGEISGGDYQYIKPEITFVQCDFPGCTEPVAVLSRFTGTNYCGKHLGFAVPSPFNDPLKK